ncbi:MAG: hypothetical protein HGA29_00085 [Syntrophaceae bacterium]|nr:hypothetical protein [Syntrophaceae bacterium]
MDLKCKSFKRLTDLPEQPAKFNILVPAIPGRIIAGIEGRYSSRRKTLSGNCTGDLFMTNFIPLGKNNA